MANEADARRLWGRKTHQLIPYVPGEQPRDRTFIKLNTNENPYPPSPAVLQIIRSYPAERLRLYPDPGSQQLRHSLAEYYGLSEKQIFVGNGSDEVLAIAFQAFFNSRSELASLGKLFIGQSQSADSLAEQSAATAADKSAGQAADQISDSERIAFPDITYSFYPVYARMYDIPYRTIPLNPDFGLPLEALMEPSAGLILANPNAPTGIAIDLATISLLAASDPNRLLIIDEAYVDFGAESAVVLLEKHDNILVVQTCSKSRSLAGMRVGYALGAPALIEALERVRDSFNSYTLDSLAQAAAVAAFSSSEWFEKTRAQIIATREKTAKALSALGFTVLPSNANFLFASHPFHAAADLYQELRQAGILVRHFRLPRIENYLRITIGTDPDMDQLIETLQQILNSRPA